jgi:hypothetical protein
MIESRLHADDGAHQALRHRVAAGGGRDVAIERPGIAGPRPRSSVRIHAPADVAVTIAPATISTVSQRAPLFAMGVLHGKSDTEPERPARSVSSAVRASTHVVQGYRVATSNPR